VVAVVIRAQQEAARRTRVKTKENDVPPVQSISPRIGQSAPLKGSSASNTFLWAQRPLSEWRGQRSRPPGQNVTSGQVAKQVFSQ